MYALLTHTHSEREKERGRKVETMVVDTRHLMASSFESSMFLIANMTHTYYFGTPVVSFKFICSPPLQLILCHDRNILF